MTEEKAQAPEWLRQAFKLLNKYMVFHWRLGLGPMGNRPELAGCIMVLVHTGRRSGLVRRTPVNYAVIDGKVYCVAGFGQAADWYRNVLANPEVEIWLPNGWYRGLAEDASGLSEAERIPPLRQVLHNSGFAARMAGIDAWHMPDADLLGATSGYRLIRITCTEARTGLGGPGDLVWVWPFVTGVLVWLLLSRRRR
ncbi:MAG: nitroreductase family deazaflavin-dependent oxidoreductase [Caldilineaceae bacterium]|nr:nitroreductase family deazaflavin-dependent oxidoreductase [Caldilineaceae bacterium]